MCIAIYKPAGKTLCWDSLKNCFEENPDGAGFMFIDPNRTGVHRLRIHKGFMSFSQFYTHYKLWESRCPNSPFVLHFRYATHGLTNAPMCHPFKLKEGIGLVHNGILQMPTQTLPVFDKCREPHDHESDTAWWCDVYFKYFSWKTFADPQFKSETETFIGQYNKLIIMNWQGKVEIYNEGKGNWSAGIWYSNYDWVPPVRSANRAQSFGYYGHGWPNDDYADESNARERYSRVLRETSTVETQYPITAAQDAATTSDTTIRKPVLPSEVRAAHQAQQSVTPADKESKSCCQSAHLPDKRTAEVGANKGAGKEIIEKISKEVQKTPSPSSLKYECVWCKKPLPRELIGLSKLCWECDDRYEELAGESPFEHGIINEHHLRDLKHEYESDKGRRDPWITRESER
jgi:hypothetical protein